MTDKPKRTEPREQHIVPRVYLKRFVDPSDPPHLQLYEKGRVGSRRRSINQILRIRDYYTLKSEDGSRDFVIESEILKSIEDRVEPVLSLIESEKWWPLDPEERETLAEFLAYQRIRVPAYLNYMANRLGEESVKFEKNLASDRNKLAETVDDLAKKGLSLPEGISVDDVRDHMLAKNEREWSVNRLFALSLVLDQVELVKNQLMDLRWTFVVFEDECSELVTGDNPVLIVADNDRRIVSYTGMPKEYPEARLLFPITPKVALMGMRSNRKDRMIVTENEGVGFFNQWAILGANRFVCARRSSDELDERFQQLSQAYTVELRDVPGGIVPPQGLTFEPS